MKFDERYRTEEKELQQSFVDDPYDRPSLDTDLVCFSWDRAWEAIARLEKSIDCMAVRVRHLPRSILH